ncbi:MAG: hypothetical protein ACOX4G_13515 [Limnochordia bacterium]|jgi:hypothetical protein
MPAGVAIGKSQAVRQTLAGENQADDMNVVFHRLLEVAQDSEEFGSLWDRLDAYLSAEVAKQRRR